MKKLIETEVDIELNDFDNSDIIKHLQRMSLDFEERTQIARIVSLTPEAIEFKIETLDDRMKYEHLLKVFSRYSLQDVERRLP
jgi:hypothetical protein